ncbi:hypothetical protein [Nocardioides sp. TF02-7]|uniref:hypothetical protein n=1 Tax=Nocardioides sp. TF02-7 TaxID=2917724 RepID=UPI001F0686D5|nr:hypothetical protein [Nocardioides sp. TF02-7]UMG92363.1 hypothetical protein MF408_21145 [Nocardioides sp. TF02-7]
MTLRNDRSGAAGGLAATFLVALLLTVTSCAAQDAASSVSSVTATGPAERGSPAAVTTTAPAATAAQTPTVPPAALAAVRRWAEARGWAARRPLVTEQFAEKPVVYVDLVRAGERRRAYFALDRAQGRWRVAGSTFLACGLC